MRRWGTLGSPTSRKAVRFPATCVQIDKRIELGGGRGPAATHQAAADILAAFLTGPLTGAASDLAATAARYPEVLGGAVEHKPAGVASAANK